LEPLEHGRRKKLLGHPPHTGKEDFQRLRSGGVEGTRWSASWPEGRRAGRSGKKTGPSAGSAPIGQEGLMFVSKRGERGAGPPVRWGSHQKRVLDV